MCGGGDTFANNEANSKINCTLRFTTAKNNAFPQQGKKSCNKIFLLKFNLIGVFHTQQKYIMIVVV